MRTRGWLAGIGALLVFTACHVSSQLGKPCTLVKSAPDGGITNITPSDLSSTAGQDIISFGAIECEDSVCVLDADHLQPALQAATGNSGIIGYCSKPCLTGTSECADQYNDLQNKADNKMLCRALVLDQASINKLCADPATCQEYLDGNRSPYFCARGAGAADAGH